MQITRTIAGLLLALPMLAESARAGEFGWIETPLIARGVVPLPPRRMEGGSVYAIVTQAAARHGVPQRLAHAVIRVESNYNCGARNRSGASGLGQLLPRTASSLGVRNSFDCVQNADGAMKYLKQAISNGGAGCAGVSLYNRGVGARPVCTAYGKRVMRLASGD